MNFPNCHSTFFHLVFKTMDPSTLCSDVSSSWCIRISLHNPKTKLHHEWLHLRRIILSALHCTACKAHWQIHIAIYQMKHWNLEPTQKKILSCFCGQVADMYPDFKSYAISHMVSDFCQVVHMKTKIHINADAQILSWRNTNHLL